MELTYVVTGAASGTGAATADLIAYGSARAIRCDLHDADVVADLATKPGNVKVVSGEGPPMSSPVAKDDARRRDVASVEERVAELQRARQQENVEALWMEVDE